MICSDLLNNIKITRTTKRAVYVFLSALLLSLFVFCASAPSVRAEKETTAPSIDSVNLREAQWVYSVYTDKSNVRYAAVTRYDGGETDVAIPDTLGGVSVRVISREAFCGNKYLTSVVIPEGVSEIGKYAFRGCIGLSSVSFPSSLTSVGDGAFFGCRSITGADFSEGLTKIGSFAFYECIHLRSVAFPSTLRSVGDSAFEGCGMLESVSFGDHLERIGDLAFMGCQSIRSVDLPSLKDLGAGAFVKCTSLKKAVLGSGVSEIRPETFRACTSLEKVECGSEINKIGVSAFEDCSSLKKIPELDSLSEISSIAFKGCTALTEAVIGRSVGTIGAGAFSGCTSLAKFTVSEENEHYASVNGCLYSKDGTSLLLCPAGKKGTLKMSGAALEIGDFAAAGCRGVSGAELREGLVSVGRGAFLGCTDLVSFSLPDSLKEIGNAAVGVYLSDGKLKKAEYVRFFASGDSCAEKYCLERELSLRNYDSTLLVSSDRVVIAEGRSFSLTCAFESQRKGEVTWSSADESVVTVRAGRLTAVSQGDAEVTVSAVGFEPKTIKVIVVSSDAIGKSKEKKYESRLIYAGESEELSSVFSQIMDPIFASNRFWYSSLPSVATVTEEGRVTAHNRGTAIITCMMPDGSEHKILVTVTEKPSELVLSAPEEELLIGQSAAVAKSFTPSFSTDSVTWSCDDEGIAVVDENGRITAVSQGKCTLTAEAASGLRSSVSVSCVIPAESISLDRETRDVFQGKQFNLKVSPVPENSKQRIIWKSSDPNVASVNSKGKVTGRSFGSAVISAETAGGLRTECRVNVLTHAEELKLDVKKLTLNCGTASKLHSIVRPSYSPETTEGCSWNSTDEKVAVVDQDGLVTAVGPGKCIINCRTGGDLISKCQVQVRLPAESIEIKPDKGSLYIGETQSLEAIILPESSTDKLEWSSGDEEIARVTTGGTVKGRTQGTTLITAKLTNDVTGESIIATVEITVMKKADSIALSKTDLSLKAGEKDSVPFTVQPEDCNDTIRWYSTDEDVASVREDGLITALSAGTCYICIETGSGATARCKVFVN